MFSFLKSFVLKLLRRIGFLEEVYYINGPEILPPPLSKKEEREILDKIIENNECCRDPLIVHNLRLVVYIAKKFESSGVSVEDLVSIGAVGLIKAVNTFKPEKNIKLATYASRCVENEILMFLRKGSQNRNDMSIDEPLNTDGDGNELLLSDILGSDQEAIGDEIEQEMEFRSLLKAVMALPPREKNIMELRFGLSGYKEHTQKEVADFLGISQSYISRLEKKIIDKLRKNIDKVIP